jgi:5'-3' exonuclease
VNCIINIIHNYSPTHIVTALDINSRTTFRFELYNQYKLNRNPTPPDLLKQIGQLAEINYRLGIRTVEKIGFEADDCIGSINKTININDKNNHRTILSTDKDMLQLLCDSTSLLRPSNNSVNYNVYTPELFEKQYNINVNQFIDYLSLTGDVSDNIPGINNIGILAKQQCILSGVCV